MNKVSGFAVHRHNTLSNPFAVRSVCFCINKWYIICTAETDHVITKLNLSLI